MAATRQTLWPIEPHTRAKHEILRRYLGAWVPILGQSRYPEVLYVDGFAGPGIYAGGEPGSPIIALTSARDQRVPIRAKVSFLFTEKDLKRAITLQEQVDSLLSSLPDNFTVEVENADFERAFSSTLDRYKRRQGRLPPTFAFVDPFGWDVPFCILAEIMSYPSCEVLITFMYEEINRFIGHPDQEKNFDRFFGCTDWREGINLIGPEIRNRFLHDLYMRQLREKACVKFVRSFQMRNDRDVTDYYLFYCTNNITGMKRMKAAMWNVDSSGEFLFSDATDQDQLVIFSQPHYDFLRQLIVNEFGGRETTRDQIEYFVVAHTAFRESHYKQVLRELEREGLLTVMNAAPSRRKGTYRSGSLRLRFD